MDEFINLVLQMRNAQKDYFLSRKKKNDVKAAIALTDSKSLERQVDDFIEKYKEDKRQTKLF